MQIESGMTKHEIQIALQDLYTILTDLGFTDTATAINYTEDTLMNEVINCYVIIALMRSETIQ